ncbi:MAG: GDP-mannose 4,6-dehydratase [Planctomycetes bacterium]|nr:GDP-mannose 4,6-dehydratase [Planctomycetota bacterium]
MRHLITGGAGFIGSHLAEALLARGDQVTVLDNLSTGSIDNIEHLRGAPRFSYTIGTVANEPLLAELIDRADKIHHLAAAVGVQLIIKSPVRTIETNIGGTELVLRHAAKKSKSVFFASTSEVYGKSTDFPFREDGELVLGAPPIGRWSYACSKALDEFLCLAYFHEHGLPATIFRLFNTVGPRQVGHYGMVLPTFVRQALEDAPITVFGTGRQSRCFSAVGDVVRAWIELSDRPASVGQTYNIGSNLEISIGELAALVKEATGSASPIELIPYERAYESGFEDMPRRVPSLSRLEEALGWIPRTSIREIIDSVVASFTERSCAIQAA